MKAVLSLEHIGADGSRHGVNYKRRPWVAQIAVNDGVIARQFLKPNRSYKNCNSKGSRGIELWFVLQSHAVYQVHAHVSWSRVDRYYCYVSDDGELHRLEESEVMQWLSGD